MTYAYDNYVQLPVVDLYDSATMQMAINAARDMYEKGQDLMKDFYKTYGDFMSPFAKDMERYGQMMGGVRDIINNAYAQGIDLLKSPEGRMLLSRVTNSINPAEVNMMRANAKTGYAYLDAMLKLRSQGKYSEAQELYDIALNGGVNFNDFSTLGKDGWNTWTRTSPIEAASLLDLTYDSYKNRTARDATIEELRAMGYPADPKYQYTAYLDSDLMKVAPGAAMAIAADPRAAYFRDLAEKKVAARGGSYTQADVDAQFYRDIADANKWALIDPQKKADEYAKMAAANEYTQSNIRLLHKLAQESQDKAHQNAMELQRLKNEGKTTIPGTKGLFLYGDASQEAGIMKLVGSLVGAMKEPEYKQDPKTGKMKPTGKMKNVTVNDASSETVLANYYSNVLTPYRKYMRNLFNSHIKYQDPDNKNDGGTHGTHAMNQYAKKFGFIDTDSGFKASTGGIADSNNRIPLSAGSIDNLYTDAEVLAMADGYRGFKNGWTHQKEIERMLSVRKENGFASVDAAKLYGNNASGYIEGIKGSADMPNEIPVIRKDGSMILLRAVNVLYGDKNNYSNTGRLWMPVGSPTLPKSYTTDAKGNLKIAGLNPYVDEAQALSLIDQNALYHKLLGGQKNLNVGLPGYNNQELIYDAETLFKLLNGYTEE